MAMIGKEVVSKMKSCKTFRKAIEEWGGGLVKKGNQIIFESLGFFQRENISRIEFEKEIIAIEKEETLWNQYLN